MPPFASVLLMYNGAKSYQMELSDFFISKLNHRYIMNKIFKTYLYRKYFLTMFEKNNQCKQCSENYLANRMRH